MKRSKLKQLMQEVTEELIISEGIIDSLIMLFLSPKIKKDVNILKNSPDWKELIHKINTTRDEMELWNGRLERYLAQCKKQVAAAKKMGIKIKDCSDLEKWEK
jgi:hypothetical protein